MRRSDIHEGLYYYVTLTEGGRLYKAKCLVKTDTLLRFAIPELESTSMYLSEKDVKSMAPKPYGVSDDVKIAAILLGAFLMATGISLAIGAAAHQILQPATLNMDKPTIREVKYINLSDCIPTNPEVKDAWFDATGLSWGAANKTLYSVETVIADVERCLDGMTYWEDGTEVTEAQRQKVLRQLEELAVGVEYIDMEN